jgi:hypothetical protein
LNLHFQTTAVSAPGRNPAAMQENDSLHDGQAQADPLILNRAIQKHDRRAKKTEIRDSGGTPLLWRVRPRGRRHENGGFLEADYLVYPWLMTIVRWDEVKSTSDYLNAIGADLNNPPPSPFFGAYRSTRNHFTPGVQFLIHANIKASFEYQIRPQQIVYVPGTTTMLSNPFRTNSAVTGLEWVY